MIEAAKKWLGYLEHQTEDLIGVYTANIGKGGHTIFAEIIKERYRWRDFSGLPWCAVFVHAVCLEAYGKEQARRLLGKPHPGTRILVRRMRRRGWLRGRDYTPKPNDLVFMHNGDGKISHVGIVECIDGDTITTIEGNTVDPSGHFPANRGGAVARRHRKLVDDAIVRYAQIDTGWRTFGIDAYILNLLDLAFTLHAMHCGAAELNPATRCVPIMIAYKVFVVGALLWWLSSRSERVARYGLRICTAAFFAVNLWHIANITAAWAA